MPETKPFPEVMCLVVDLAEAMGVRSIKDLPGCWEVDLGGGWWMAVNGHREPTRCSRQPEKFAGGVAPFCAYFEFNGWPAGVISPRDGCMAAGAAANEGTLVEALKAKIEAARAAGRG